MCQEINVVIFSFLKGIYKLQKLTFKMLRPAETWFGQNGQVQILEKKATCTSIVRYVEFNFKYVRIKLKFQLTKHVKRLKATFSKQTSSRASLIDHVMTDSLVTTITHLNFSLRFFFWWSFRKYGSNEGNEQHCLWSLMLFSIVMEIKLEQYIGSFTLFFKPSQIPVFLGKVIRVYQKL